MMGCITLLSTLADNIFGIILFSKTRNNFFMAKLLADQLHVLLKWSDIRVAKGFLAFRLSAHPYRHSMVSLTDTLDELRIGYSAVKVGKDELGESKCPFIAHLAVNGGEFLLIRNYKEIERKHPGFFEKWDGVILSINEAKWVDNEESRQYLARERKWKGIKILLSAGMAAVLALSVRADVTIAGLSLLLTCFAGLAISVLIVRREMGHSDKWVEKLCHTEKTDCNAVLGSKASRLWGWLGMSDLGLIYFLSQSAVVVIAIAGHWVAAAYAILFILSLTAIPFTFFSLYYQRFVVGKWCVLCLSVLALLWLQPVSFFGYFGSLAGALKHLDPGSIKAVPVIFCLSAGGWLFLRRLLESNKERLDGWMHELRFKRNPEIFMTLLRQQQSVDTSAFEHDLQLGNPRGPVQLIAVVNLFCPPCAAAHAVLHELMETHKGMIGLTVRLVVRTDRTEDKKYLATAHLLQYFLENAEGLKGKPRALLARQIVADWFAQPDYLKFRNSHPVKGKSDVSQLLAEHEQWCVKADVNFTPTLFVGGFRAPGQYSLRDLSLIIPSLSELFVPEAPVSFAL
jgi:uncharacterized membrane protein